MCFTATARRCCWRDCKSKASDQRNTKRGAALDVVCFSVYSIGNRQSASEGARRMVGGLEAAKMRHRSDCLQGLVVISNHARFTPNGPALFEGTQAYMAAAGTKYGDCGRSFKSGYPSHQNESDVLRSAPEWHLKRPDGVLVLNSCPSHQQGGTSMPATFVTPARTRSAPVQLLIAE
jgi:hypothetical protein